MEPKGEIRVVYLTSHNVRQIVTADGTRPFDAVDYLSLETQAMRIAREGFWQGRVFIPAHRVLLVRVIHADDPILQPGDLGSDWR